MIETTVILYCDSHIFSQKVCTHQVCPLVSHVTCIIQFHKAVMIYELMNGLYPDSLKSRLLPRSYLSNYSVGNQLDLDVARLNLEFSENNVFYTGEKTRNYIPLPIRTSSTITTSRGN